MSQPTLSEQLVGAWSLVSYEVLTADGTTQRPLGADAMGLLIYGPHRHMTVQIMASDRQRWRAQSQGPQRLAELAAAADGYLAYAGTYEVDETARTVTHHVELSLIPNWVSCPQRRAVDLQADSLILTAEPSRFQDEIATPRLTWRRAHRS
jgi:Lipocalin-like domain